MNWHRFPDFLPGEHKKVLAYVSKVDPEGRVGFNRFNVLSWSINDGWKDLFYEDVCVDFWCGLPALPLKDCTSTDWHKPPLMPGADKGVLTYRSSADYVIYKSNFNEFAVNKWSHRFGWRGEDTYGAFVELWCNIINIPEPDSFKLNAYFTPELIKDIIKKRQEND